jgi:hypothetical protein
MQVIWEGNIKTLPPIERRIVETVGGPWWWRQRQYWIESDYCRVGPFDTKSEAGRALSLFQRG